MQKSAKIMMIFSVIFVTITIFLFAFTTTFVINSLIAFYKPNPDAGDVIGGLILFIAMLPFCLGMFASAVSILPFNLVMMIKMKIKTWYTISILTFAIAMILLSIVYCIAFPLSTVTHASTSSSSRSA